MNTNSNTYTVIYSTILVVIVAAVLAFAASSLKPRQEENVKVETITKVLSAAGVENLDEATVMEVYAQKIESAFYVNGLGVKGKEMNLGKENVKDIQVATTSDLKAQYDVIKNNPTDEKTLEGLQLPVYVFNIDDKKVTVLPCYGPGLWGPIWGYVAVAEDGIQILGAIFDHQGETPGLGAKIADDPTFRQSFKGKKFIEEAGVFFNIVKGGAKDAENGVDAISGATITSQSLEKVINNWIKYYQPYFAGVPTTLPDEILVESCGENTCCQDCDQEVEQTNTEEE